MNSDEQPAIEALIGLSDRLREVEKRVVTDPPTDADYMRDLERARCVAAILDNGSRILQGTCFSTDREGFQRAASAVICMVIDTIADIYESEEEQDALDLEGEPK